MSTTEEPTLPPATERSSYSVWARDRLRFGDTDLQGHINNAVFATFCETGRVSFLFDEDLNLRGPGASFVIARLELDYRAELFYPGEVEIGTRVLHVGRTSFRLGQGIFNGDICAATGASVLVLMDDATRKPKALTPQLRAWLEARQVA
ncbi:MAG TPA: thioesterase family protein [Stellaceae bacterium]|nr:thioesterase family protein [Stellaceae bacterium]